MPLKTLPEPLSQLKVSQCETIDEVVQCLVSIVRELNEINVVLMDTVNNNADSVSTGWTMTNVSSDKVLDADSTSLAEVADVLGTLITDMITSKHLSA